MGQVIKIVVCDHCFKKVKREYVEPCTCFKCKEVNKKIYDAKKR